MLPLLSKVKKNNNTHALRACARGAPPPLPLGGGGGGIILYRARVQESCVIKSYFYKKTSTTNVKIG